MIILTGSNGFIGKNFKSKLSNVIELDKENCWDFLHSILMKIVIVLFLVTE